LAENKLIVYQISIDQLKLLKECQLEVPSFYKKMPDDFYDLGEMGQDTQTFGRNIFKMANRLFKNNKCCSGR
jgi:hypothetical protein